jgi:LacI family transcriptional regulator
VTDRFVAAGLDLVGAPMSGEWSEAWGRQAVRMLLGAGDPFDAVFCGSDQIARGVADALQAAINGEPSPGRHTSPCRLVIRDSTD